MNGPATTTRLVAKRAKKRRDNGAEPVRVLPAQQMTAVREDDELCIRDLGSQQARVARVRDGVRGAV